MVLVHKIYEKIQDKLRISNMLFVNVNLNMKVRVDYTRQKLRTNLNFA